MICPLCRDTLSEALGTERPVSYTVGHHSSFQTLRLSAENGCDTCQLFQNAVLRAVAGDAYPETGRWHPEHDTTTGFVISAQWKTIDPELSRGHLSCSRFYYDVQQGVDVGNMPSFKVKLLRGDVPSLAGQEIAEEIDLSIAAQWVRACAQRHQKCPGLEEMDLPTRLIDVGHDDQDPRLVTTVGQRGQYVALSHRWGDSEPPQDHSIERHHQGIPHQGMPRTFRDAVQVVRNLGLRMKYIWIDWYCIRQGDQEDFDNECAKMYSTFANASLTICGPEATDTNAGLLHPRLGTNMYPDEKLEIDLLMNGELVRVSIEEEMDEERTPKNTYSELAKRAWIVQERLLSPRVLFFGKNHMYMECASADFFENLSYPLAALSYPFSKTLLRKGSPDTLLSEWLSIIKEYSRCDITKADDRLPALSGTASLLQNNLQCEYHAGLWQSDLILGLSWYCNPRGDWRTKSPETLEQMARSRMPASIDPPSWSWVSCDYGLSHVFWPLRSRVDYAEVLRINSSAVGSNPFGQVRKVDSTLVLRAPSRLIQIQCDMEADGWREDWDTRYDLCAYPSEPTHQPLPIGRVDRDWLLTQAESEAMREHQPKISALLLLLASRGNGGLGQPECPLEWCALVLIPDDAQASTTSKGGPIYRRIGMVHRFIGDGSMEHFLGPKGSETRIKSPEAWQWVRGGQKMTVEIK